MTVSTSELESLRDALIRARLAGHRTVSYEGREITYKSDAEMSAALGWVERQLASPQINAVKFSSSKGLE